MRKTVNISLTEELKEEVDKAVESGRYSSRSEFFRELIRLWKEKKVLEDVHKSRKQIREGQGEELDSVKKSE
ncbi:MAG: type II toxin-antitoxin system ParD family antitoxin [Candidatus Magasanikbacteria bacterium]